MTLYCVGGGNEGLDCPPVKCSQWSQDLLVQEYVKEYETVKRLL